MIKKIIISMLIIILISIPLFIFNEKPKEKNIIKKEVKVKKEKNREYFKYITTNYDNINEYIKTVEKEEEIIRYVCIDNKE